MSEQKPIKIFLGGKLGKLFGKTWELYVKSPGEAFRAINTNTKGAFFKYLQTDGYKKYYKVSLQKKENLISNKEISYPSGKGSIFISPALKGKESGENKIIAGIVLIASSFIPGVGPALSSTLLSTGVSLMLGGIVQLLTPVPTDAKPDQDESLRQSSVFRGNATSVFQGGSVGLIYGKALVAPMPVSIVTNSNDPVIIYPTYEDDQEAVQLRYLNAN